MGNAIRVLSDSERLDWLRLYRSENVGPVTFFRLLEQFGSAGAALAALPDLARQGGGRRPITVGSKAAAQCEIEALDRLGGSLLTCWEPGFPAPLRALETAPLITLLGMPALLTRPAVAVVGARNASAAGRRMAQLLAEGLGREGVVVVSGLARGIDAAAHEAALATGTLAVLAGGVDVVYPSENDALYRRIRDGGCLISEMPPGTQPQATHFPRRNRLISGCSLGVVVVEAAARSGSLITAHLALDQGREVFAVPGSPLDPRCQGPNRLIREGATLTEGAEDVMAVLAPLLHHPLTEPAGDDFRPRPPQMPEPAARESARRAVQQSLGATPVTVDEIVRQCQLSPAMVSLCLLELELAGRLERHPGQRVSLIF